LNAVFLTHFHSDHTSGIPDLWLTGWIGRYYGNRQSPFRVIGPKGTVSLMQNLERAYADDIRIRYADEKNPMEGVAIAASEYTSDGAIYEKNGVTVTAFEVDHGALIKPAYGYRIDYDGRSVIISGDTRYSENLEKHAQGATLVVHEVAIANPEYYDKTPIVKYIMAHHITPQEAGSLFARLKPKLAAYTHLVFLGSPAYPAPKVADLERTTRETYSGPLALGTDLMAFDVRNDQVIVIPDGSKK
jgi:ribonuclease Z